MVRWPSMSDGAPHLSARSSSSSMWANTATGGISLWAAATSSAPGGHPAQDACSYSTKMAFLAALRAITFAFAVMLAEVVAVTAVLFVWEELKLRRRRTDHEKTLLNCKWISGVSRERDIWEVEQPPCTACSRGACDGGTRCIAGALVPRYVGPKRTPCWNNFLWHKLLSMYSHRGRVSILFAIANVSATLVVILFLPIDFTCGSGSLQKQSAADVFVLLGTEAALSLVLFVVTLVLFAMGLPSPTHSRHTILVKDDARLMYALMGLELVENPSAGSVGGGGPSWGERHGGGAGAQFVFSRTPWRSELHPSNAPGTAFFARRLHVLGRLLKHLEIYEEVMLLLYPWPRKYMRRTWEIKKASAKEASAAPPPPGHPTPSPRFPCTMNLDGLRHTVESSAGEWTEFVVRFWNKTQAGSLEVRNNDMSAFVPTEVEVATLIMKKILDMLDVLPQPQDLFFSIVTSLTVNWVITFIALFGDYDGTVFGVLYGGAQVTAFSGFWYFVLSVQWQKATPRGYVGNRVRQVLDDIDSELLHCKLTDGDDEDESIYEYWPPISAAPASH